MRGADNWEPPRDRMRLGGCAGSPQRGLVDWKPDVREDSSTVSFRHADVTDEEETGRVAHTWGRFLSGSRSTQGPAPSPA
jgi:hypothetical protein